MAEEGTNIRVKLNDVRLSFAEIFEPKVYGDDPNGTPRHSANFLIHKVDQKELAEKVSAAVKSVIKAQWKDKPPQLGPKDKCFRDGEPKDDEDVRHALYDGYEGHFFVRASSPVDRPPTIIDSRKGADGKFPRLTARDGRPYAGCRVNAIVSIWAQDNRWGKKVNASLEAIQFARHDEAFGATRVNAEEEFEDLGVEGDDLGPAAVAVDDDDLV